jgi:hypothetical protein
VAGQLAQANNAFSGIDFGVPPRQMCMPPGTSISVANGAITIANRFCTITFSLNPGEVTGYFADPGSGLMVKLADGSSRFETWTLGIRVVTNFAGREHNILSSRSTDVGQRNWWRAPGIGLARSMRLRPNPRSEIHLLPNTPKL